MSILLRPFEIIGRRVLNMGATMYDVLSLFAQTLYWTFLGPFLGKFVGRKYVFAQMVFVGIRSIAIVFFVAAFTGIVLAMQSAYQLDEFGATIYVASLVAISITRELGPVLVALVVTGRVGAAITAELGTMKVTEQIEALETMALNPVRFLVVPRFLALLIMLPCLTIIGDLVGILGGWFIGVTSLHLNSTLYFEVASEFLKLKDVFTGLFKSVIFSMIISIVGCYQGLNTKGGAEGVGKATTISVVTSFILIILADCVLTAIFYFTKV
ncbi:MAG: ABC transporter permease [Candidatus Omnitrophota bacterium]